MKISIWKNVKVFNGYLFQKLNLYLKKNKNKTYTIFLDCRYIITKAKLCFKDTLGL